MRSTPHSPSTYLPFALVVLLVGCGKSGPAQFKDAGPDGASDATQDAAGFDRAAQEASPGPDTDDGRGGGDGGESRPDVPSRHYLYVANNATNDISRFSIDEATGVLTVLGTTPAEGGPGLMALNPENSRLYLALRNSRSVTAYDIDAASGALTEIGTTVVDLNPVYLRLDATGAFLLMTSFNGNTVRVHAIAADGSVAAGAVDSESTGMNPHSVMIDPSNQWAFVPLTNNTPDLVLQYDFDPRTGTLTPNGQAPATMGAGPRHSIFHPTGPWYYTVNEHDDTVTRYAFDASNGTIAATSSTSTLPAGFDGASNTCADIHITPDGRFLYASNRGHDSLAMFAVSTSDGTLTSLGQVPTEAMPRAFEIALGRFVYAAGESSGKLAAYTIEPTNGTLEPIATYPVGDAPGWVTAASLPR